MIVHVQNCQQMEQTAASLTTSPEATVSAEANAAITADSSSSAVVPSCQFYGRPKSEARPLEQTRSSKRVWRLPPRFQ